MTASGLERWLAVSLAIHALGISLWVAAGPGGRARPSAPVPVRVLLVDAAPAPAPGGEKGVSAKGRGGEAPRAAPRRPVRRETAVKTSAPPKRSGRTTVEIRRRQPARIPRRTDRTAPRTIEHRPRPEPAKEAAPPRPRPEPVPVSEPKPQPPPPAAASHEVPEPEPPAPPAEARPADLPEPPPPSEPPRAAEALPKEPAAPPEAERSAPARTDGPLAGPAAASLAVEGPAPKAPAGPPARAGAVPSAQAAPDPPSGAGSMPGPAPSEGTGTARTNVGDRDAQPDYAAITPPPYPRLARRRGWQGVVRLRVRVSPDGRVLDASVEQSSGYRVLDRAALEAVRGWRFRPAVRGGEPVASEVVVPVRFSLNRSG
ncbi:TonB family protein [Deferrisoma camini]|uniref:TonB family protein n=1 Tax=Deferrisoma camini TaxID=1035120 RepID=UPI00046D9237|nr:TonB family protein [Deferrisoma camini]